MPKLGNLLDKPVHGKTLDDPALIIPDAKIGIEVECENFRSNRNPPPLWTQKHDDSLRNSGIEFITSGGMVGADIRQAVTQITSHCTALNLSDGTPRAGIHIHLDVTDLDFQDKELARLVCNYMIVEHIMFAFAGEWRRHCGYCHPMETAQGNFETLGQFLYNQDISREDFKQMAGNMSKYQGLNLRSLSQFGTVEFRHLPTTFDPKRIMTWINLILAIKKSATDRELSEPLRCLSRLGPHEYVQRILGAELYAELGGLVDTARIWAAIDNATALMSYGNAIEHAKEEWPTSNDDNPILEAKKAKYNVKKSPKVKKQEEPAAIITLGQALEANALDDLETVLLYYQQNNDVVGMRTIQDRIQERDAEFAVPEPQPF